MFKPANAAQFTLTIPAASHDLQVLAFTGEEAISTPYSFHVDCVSRRADLDLEALLDQPAFLSFGFAGEGIHGLIHQVGQGESGKRLTRYSLTLVPCIAYLDLRTNHRIFQAMTVQQIIVQVLKEHGILADVCHFHFGPTPYPERNYCVQYGESDLHFLHRLCEEEGIHYHFQHHADGHHLIFGDDQTVFTKLGRPTAYAQDTGLVADEPVIKRFGKRIAARISHVAHRDYNFEKPRLQMQAQTGSEAAAVLERYEYPGRFADRLRGKHLSKRILERDRADYALAEGDGDQPTLRSGYFLELSDHPRQEWNDLWLLGSVRHEGRQPQVLEESISSQVEVGDGFQQGYRNWFTATPWDVFYRPPACHRKPLALATQTAVVTGPPGEEIYCDQYGRVKVQFFWDRSDQYNDNSSCWVRVASSWAGSRYGAIAVPRVGMEVVVSFLEGDPDQPIISGCLHHAEHLVPYDLPANKTRTVFKTSSTPGGGGFNELRIEDRAGQEQIYIHAQRDQDCVVENNETHCVGVNRLHNIGQDETIMIGQNRSCAVKVDDTLRVGGAKLDSVGTGYLMEAGEQIRLVCGQSVLEMHADGRINLSGVQFNLTVSGDGEINTGGDLNLNMPGGAAATAPGADGIKGTIESNVNAIFTDPPKPAT
ncbi:type VI secretion system tip protein VgrG [Pseudomonas juntendi]|uniref:type VI secretion system Vgr family protein n=1 Tax=Pseudomonas juntendi TaxID=2666183 RepID=UPI0032084159